LGVGNQGIEAEAGIFLECGFGQQGDKKPHLPALSGVEGPNQIKGLDSYERLMENKCLASPLRDYIAE